MAEQLSYIVFTDFDGTVTRTDIGDALFKVFGDGKEAARAFRESTQQMIPAQESWRRSCTTVALPSLGHFESFVDGHEIDGGFTAFEQYCAGHSIPVVILSDGFDLYIEQVLRREKLAHLPFFSNKLVVTPDGSVTPQFPYTDSECIMCANCKRNHIVTRSSDEQVIVYIGNGHSDQCPARYADIVFAKDTLLRYCERENITYHRFDSFDDVLERFKTIVEHGKPKKRRTAELARKDLFLRG